MTTWDEHIKANPGKKGVDFVRARYIDAVPRSLSGCTDMLSDFQDFGALTTNDPETARFKTQYGYEAFVAVISAWMDHLKLSPTDRAEELAWYSKFAPMSRVTTGTPDRVR